MFTDSGIVSLIVRLIKPRPTVDASLATLLKLKTTVVASKYARDSAAHSYPSRLAPEKHASNLSIPHARQRGSRHVHATRGAASINVITSRARWFLGKASLKFSKGGESIRARALGYS